MAHNLVVRGAAIFVAVIAFAIALPSSAQLVINEIEYDQVGTDTGEYIEIKNVSLSAINLSLVRIDLINGATTTPTVYGSFTLPPTTLAAGAYFVLCANAATVTPCHFDVLPDTNLIQNGAPDAVAIVWDGVIVDRVSYEGSTPGYTEGTGTTAADDNVTASRGIGRLPDGVDTDNNDLDFVLLPNSPGAPNFAQPTATVSGDATICAGQPATISAALTGTPLWSLTWSDGFIQDGISESPATRVVSPAATTAYTVTEVFDANGPGSSSGSATITVNPAPVAPVISAPESVVIGATNQTASVVDHPGSTYTWSLTGGTITAGQGTAAIEFAAGEPGTRMTLSVVETTGGCSSPAAATYVMVDYNDVPPSHIFHDFVISIARAGITSGCGSGNYCVNDMVLRSQMAVFLLRGMHGGGFAPPPATGIFDDVTIPSFFADFIEALYNEGITGGCASAPLRYCPSNPVLRSQMAIFLLRAKYGSGHTPPPATGIFEDVPIGSFGASFIEQLYNEGITSGCSAPPLRYCPNDPTTRGAMAVFLTRTFTLP